MNKKIILLLIIILLSLLAVGILTQQDNKNQDNTNANITILEVSYSGPYNLNKIIHEIKTEKYYTGYDTATLAWMGSLSQNKVFYSNNSIVIMNEYDASKIHHNKIDITDVYIVENIECIVVENRSLGGKKGYDILLVKDVKDLGNKTYPYEV